MIYLIMGFLIALSVGEGCSAQESFLAQPAVQKQKKKVKKSLSAMRQEYIEQCEQYAHTLIAEMLAFTQMMAKKHSKGAELVPAAIIRERFAELDAAVSFFSCGLRKKVHVIDELSSISWQLMQQYARVQEKLLCVITDLLEQDEKSCFMTTDKQLLQRYEESLHSLQEESELLVQELQAMSNQATVKK